MRRLLYAAVAALALVFTGVGTAYAAGSLTVTTSAACGVVTVQAANSGTGDTFTLAITSGPSAADSQRQEEGRLTVADGRTESTTVRLAEDEYNKVGFVSARVVGGNTNGVDVSIPAAIRVDTDCNNGNDGTVRNSCADYARDGIYDIPRGDFRYRDFLDRDGDGVACERNGDDGRFGRGGVFNRDRDCRDLRDARDEARRLVTEANTRITDAQALTSADGASITAGERLEIDQKVRDAQTAIRKFEDDRVDVNNRCDAADADLGVALLPIPGDSTVVTSVAPPPPASTTIVQAPPAASGSVPRGSVNTGDGSTAEGDVNLPVTVGAVAALTVAVGLGVRVALDGEAEANQR